MVLLSNDNSGPIKRHCILKCFGPFNISVLLREETLKEYTDDVESLTAVAAVVETSLKSVFPQRHRNPSAAREI